MEDKKEERQNLMRNYLIELNHIFIEHKQNVIFKCQLEIIESIKDRSR